MRTKRDIDADLRGVGARCGDSVIVHSSFKSIGPVQGGPQTVIEALIEVLLPHGALLFPNLYIPHGFTADAPPHFDLKGEHIRNLGIIPETFKFKYAEHFSIHPTHSLMGAGDRAPSILADHEIAGLPCGLGTPWAKNASQGGKVLLIGVDQRVNTTYHSAEEQMEEPYQLTDQAILGIVKVDGREVIVPSRLHVWLYHPDFNLLNAELEAQGHLTHGHIGDAPAMCLDAGRFVELATAKLAADRGYFLNGQPV